MPKVKAYLKGVFERIYIIQQSENIHAHHKAYNIGLGAYASLC